MKKRLHRIAVSVILALASAASASARDIPVKRVFQEPRESRTPPWYAGERAVAGHVPSTRNLLGLERAHRFALPTAESAARLKTLRVAVLRVQFAREVPDDPRTTGDGHFDLRDSLQFFAQEGHQFEQAPHNADFFNTVMRAMTRYYSVVSNGRLTIDYDIFPRGRDSAYTLDSSMCWYGEQPPNDGLAFFLIDAVQKADTDPDLVFADYDAYILFHAGSDAQHDFSPITPTPCDLFTAYVRLLDTAFFVPVDGGTHFVEDGVILPETATQDNRGTGLNGIVAHEFGHVLGLVDIYSTRTGTTQVGDFSLMDNDAQSVGVEFGVPWSISTFFDLLPVYPDAWSRAFLGFVDPKVVLPDSILARSHPDPDSADPFIVSVAEGTVASDFAPQMLQVPISSREYYLVEFRSPDQDVNTNTTEPGDQGVGVRFDSSFNAVLGPATCNPTTLGELDSCRVLGRDYDFQFFQPGETGGLLIWHVDEEVGYRLVPQLEGDPYLKNNFDANTLQWDRFRRFLEIEEADGLVNFGGNYFTYFGGQQELFVGGGNDEFGPTTNPSTSSHTGAPSHLRLYDISPVYPPNASPQGYPIHHMQLKIANERAAAGWPQPAGRSSAPGLTVLRGTSEDTVLTASGRYVLAWTGSGSSLLSQLPGDEALALLPRLDGTFDTLVLAGFARADTTLVTSPSVGSDTAAGTRRIAAVDVNGRVYVWAFADAGNDGWADVEATFDLGAAAPRPPSWFDSDDDGDEEMFVAGVDNGQALWWEDGTGTVSLLNANSVRDWAVIRPWGIILMAADDGIEQAFPRATPVRASLGRPFESIVAADDDRDGIDAIFARAGSRLYRIDLTGAPRVDHDVDPRLSLHGDLSSGDHDGDGVPSVFVGAGEWLAGFQPNLALERAFPLRGNDLYSADPISAAITADEFMYFGGADGEVQAHDAFGEPGAGWPLFVGDTVVSLATVRAGADSTVVIARSTNGYIWGTKIAGTAVTPGAWTQTRGDARQQNRWDDSGVPVPQPGATTAAVEQVFAYPNPSPRGPVRIRYYLAEAGPVEVSVYDLAGNKIVESTASGMAGMDNEWIWDASTVAPGVYYCRVQARGGEPEFCKVAISP